MGNFLENWANESPDQQKLLAEEELILAVTERIWEELERQEMNKTDLASSLDKSKAFVSQVLSGSRNMTLRTLANIAFALGLKPKFDLLQDGEDRQWLQIGNVAATHLIPVEGENQDDDWSAPTPIEYESKRLAA